jgi:hypothetical protein
MNDNDIQFPSRSSIPVRTPNILYDTQSENVELLRSMVTTITALRSLDYAMPNKISFKLHEAYEHLVWCVNAEHMVIEAMLANDQERPS